MLYRMVEMISATGCEAHRLLASGQVCSQSLACIELYSRCILQGCDVFRRNMTAAVEKVVKMRRVLPNLDCGQGIVQEQVKIWKSQL